MAIKVILKNGTTLEFAKGQLIDPGNSHSGVIVITQGREVGFQVVALLNTVEILAAFDTGAGHVVLTPPAS